MTRMRTQTLSLVIYLAFGLFAVMLPGTVLGLLGISEATRTPVSLLLVRMFGAVCVGLALTLFFALRDHAGGKRVMRAFAGLEVAVVVAAVLSLGADDIGMRAGLIVAIGSAAIGLVNLYGAFLAPAEAKKSPEPQPEVV